MENLILWIILKNKLISIIYLYVDHNINMLTIGFNNASPHYVAIWMNQIKPLEAFQKKTKTIKSCGTISEAIWCCTLLYFRRSIIERLTNYSNYNVFQQQAYFCSKCFCTQKLILRLLYIYFNMGGTNKYIGYCTISIGEVK